MPPLKEDRYKTIIAMIMALLLFQILFFSSFWDQRSGSGIRVKRSTKVLYLSWSSDFFLSICLSFSLKTFNVNPQVLTSFSTLCGICTNKTISSLFCLCLRTLSHSLMEPDSNRKLLFCLSSLCRNFLVGTFLAD